jgi:hypothetical protein
MVKKMALNCKHIWEPIEMPLAHEPNLAKGGQAKTRLNSASFPKRPCLKASHGQTLNHCWGGLWETYQPEGKLEEILLEKLACILWRSRRLLLAESAEIQKYSDFRELNSQDSRLNLTNFMSHKLDPLISRVHNPDVFERCLELLTELGQGIGKNGFDEEKDELLLCRIYGAPDASQIRKTLQDEYSAWLDTARVAEEERAREGYATPEQCKKNVLQAIAAEIVRLKRDYKKFESIKSERRKVEILRQNVPDSPGLDRLLRYESSLERAFDRTLSQLERSQRIHNGQPLLLQLDVEVS